MICCPRFLITTADEQTWKFDRPVIFMGEWCRVYDRRHIWQDMDAIVAPPYGLGHAKKVADLAEARALEDRLFPELCAVLNQYHGTQHDKRFWKIVLGHWFRRYVDMVLNRVKTIEQCMQTYRLSGMTAFSTDHYALATQDSYSAIWGFNDDRWNNALTVRILELLEVTGCTVEIIPADVSEGFRWNALATDESLKRKVLKWLYQQAGKLLSLMARDNDALIINSYLPKKEEIKLQLALWQIPQLLRSQQLEILKKPDRALRQKLSGQIAAQTGKSLADVIGALIFELLPVCYLEGFAELNSIVQQQPWPKKPKFIFTSNNFDTDDVFKLWAAQKTESGSKYIAGQHGNNYGTYRYMYPAVEETTADNFLTWGWTDGLAQHTPAFVFNTAGRKDVVYNPNGGLLLIELCMNHRITTWDGTSEFADYFQDQQSFVNKLMGTPRSNLVVRLHVAHQYFNWNEEARWQAFDRAIKIDTGEIAISNLIAQSRLVVHSYDSTGILETLSQNIPTLAFWQDGFDHLRDSAKPYYQLLVDAGIIHLTPDSAAQKVNEVWDDVDGWWGQSAVQKARSQFCDRYARVSQSHVHDLKKLLQEQG